MRCRRQPDLVPATTEEVPSHSTQGKTARKCSDILSISGWKIKITLCSVTRKCDKPYIEDTRHHLSTHCTQLEADKSADFCQSFCSKRSHQSWKKQIAHRNRPAAVVASRRSAFAVRLHTGIPKGGDETRNEAHWAPKLVSPVGFF